MNLNIFTYFKSRENQCLLSLGYEIFGLDVGAAWFPKFNDGIIPTVGIQPRALILSSIKSNVSDRFRVYPLLTNTAAWNIGKNVLYSGYDFTLPLTEPDYDDEAASFIISPFIGYSWKITENFNLLTELKWHGANIESDMLAVEYIPIGGYGAITTLFSIERRF